MMKKGAMFGLDARIALAILGALSVISGAALYSAIAKAKVVSMATDLTEVEKAVDAYFLDTGEELVIASDNPAGLYTDLTELLSSTKTNWGGPYLSYSMASPSLHVMQHTKSETGRGIFVAKGRDTAWGNSSNIVACNSTDLCYYWVGIYGLHNTFIQELHDYFDTDGNIASGNARVYAYASPNTQNHLYIKFRIVK